jgi:hypothetical protein
MIPTMTKLNFDDNRRSAAEGTEMEIYRQVEEERHDQAEADYLAAQRRDDIKAMNEAQARMSVDVVVRRAVRNSAEAAYKGPEQSASDVAFR